MQERKVRVWDKEKKVMYTGEEAKSLLPEMMKKKLPKDTDQYAYMESTDLFDKNCVEIYVNDILKLERASNDDKEASPTYMVISADALKRINVANAIKSMFERMFSKTEVIGNIYDEKNKEILERYGRVQ